MPRLIVALISGTLFGLGLTISGMINPAKVIGFLNIAGEWDPTLAFVMGGALVVTIPAFRWVLKQSRPAFDESFAVPTRTDLEPRLLGGATLFGVGWGMSGFCPGPALTALAAGIPSVFFFVAAMVAGMVIYGLVFERPRTSASKTAGPGSLTSSGSWVTIQGPTASVPGRLPA